MQELNYNKTIVDIFYELAKKKSFEILIEFNDQFISSDFFWKKVKQKSIYLENLFSRQLQRNIFPGECIGLVNNRTPETLSDMVAILFAGGSFVPFDSKSSKEQINYLFSDANIKLYLDQGTAYFTEQNLNFSLNNVDKNSPENLLNKKLLPIHPNQLAYVMYTSGSSGKPKGVKISHRAWWGYCNWFSSLDIIQSCHRIDFSTNLTFDASITTSLVSLAHDKTISICPEEIKYSPHAFLNYLIEKKIDLCKCTPSYFRQLKNESQYSNIKIPHVVKWLLTGEEMSAKDSAVWLREHPNHILYNSYGPTEATVTCSKVKIDINNIKKFKTKIPIESNSRACKFLIVDPTNMSPVANGVRGELCIEGDILADGYLNRPEETKKSFIRGLDNCLLYRTGDEVISSEDGYIYYYGRLDSQIKIRGIRVELDEIQNALCSINNILDARVIVLDKDNPSQMLAFIVPREKVLNEFLFLNQIKSEFANKFYFSIIPERFIILDKIPTNLSGKTDLQNLKILAKNSIVTTKKQQVTNPLEMSILQVWRESLPPNKIGIDTDFFDLGGHSLLAMEVIDKINYQLNTSLPPNIIFQNSTIRTLANAILDTQVNHSLHHICHNKNGPLLFLIHPATGLGHVYHELKSYLDEFDFYALSNDRFGEHENSYKSIEEMANSYIQIMQRHCPNGPYIIGGFCMGGVVAFEMCKQLQNIHNMNHNALILIDSFMLKNIGSEAERNLYNKEQLKLRNLPENSPFGQKIIYELNHNQELVIKYRQENFKTPCLFIECEDMIPEELQNNNFFKLKNENLGWNLSCESNILIKKGIKAFHKTLFVDKIAIKVLSDEIKSFCSLIQKTREGCH